MEGKFKKILIVAFVGLVAVLLAWQWLVIGPLWAKIAEKVQEHETDCITVGELKKMDGVMLADSSQEPPTAEAAEKNLKTAEEQARILLERIRRDDVEFESFFKDENGREVETPTAFADLYPDYVKKILLTLLEEKGVYNPPSEGASPAIRVEETIRVDISEEERKALQKQAWIYQRIEYSLLKTTFDGKKPLVRELLPPSGKGKQAVAIAIAYCEKDDEEKKADPERASEEPLFYGKSIEPITVSFSVILDERCLWEFIDEMRVYDEVRGFRKSVTEKDEQEMRKIGKVKPIVFEIKSMKISRLTPQDNHTVPGLEEEVARETREDADNAIEQMIRPLKVELVLNVLDYNPHFEKK